MPAKRDDIDSDDLIRRYRNGASTRQLSADFGVAKGTIVRILKESNVPIRDKSAAGKNRARNPVAAARAANRGRPIATAIREQIATTKHERLSQTIGAGEEEISDALVAAGFEVRRQVAVGRYNLDITAGPVAVEVHRYAHGPHLDRAGLHRRVDYLTDAGWRVVYVWTHRGVSSTDLEQVISLVHEVGTKPPTPGQYRVFRCDGDRPARRYPNSHHGAYVVTTRSVGDA